MQEVKGYLDGNYDYTQLKGDTGPCVYPAGFVYVFSFFYYITDEGKNIQAAQLIYLYLYLANLYVVFEIYKTIEGNISVMTYVLCSFSYRMHSIFILRLFNDPVAMLFMNICILFCCYNRWQGALFFYSIALSIKMNILLYLPAFLLLICWARGFRAALTTLMTIILWQILIAYPFLKVNPAGYFERAFNFGRQFTQIWSVNWQFLPSEVFLSSTLSRSLLLLHILLLLHFLISKASTGRTLLERYKSLNLPCSWQEFKCSTNHSISPQAVVYCMFTINFIGILCCRSIHYQFYSWYFYSLPYFAGYGMMSLPQLAVFFSIEYVYFAYPPTALNSALLQVCHLLVYLRLQFITRKATPYALIPNKQD